MTDSLKEKSEIKANEGCEIGQPVSSKTSEWAKDKDEEDRVEQMIRKTGCWDNHISVVECMIMYNDWRKCQNPLYVFRSCMSKGAAADVMKDLQTKSLKN